MNRTTFNRRHEHMTTDLTHDLSAFAEADALPEQQIESTGYRRLQHFNESTTYHRGSLIERGGYGINDENGDAPDIGKSETIKHRGGNSTIMRVAKQVEIALIGFSPKYFKAEYDDPGGALDNAGRPKRVNLIVPHYMQPGDMPGANGRCRSAISYFVAVKADAERKLYETTFSGYIADDAARMVNEARGYGAQVAQAIAKAKGMTIKPRTFMLWLPLGVGESKMVGKVEQSAVTPPAWKLANDEDLMQRLVSGDDFRAFAELYKELLAYLETGRYGGATNGAPQLAAPMRQGQAIADMSAPSAPANQFDAAGNYAAGNYAAGNYAKANGDVNI